MPTLTFAQIAEMAGGDGRLQGGDVVTSSVVIDSREVKPDSVFFAIKGDRLDGHQFLPQALATARGAVVSQLPDPLPEGKASSESTTPPRRCRSWRARSASAQTSRSSPSPAPPARRPPKR